MSTRPGASIFALSIFPIVMFGSIGVSIALFNRGASDGWATVAGLLFGYTLVILGERLYPFVPDWNRNHDDVGTDAAWAGATLVVGGILRPLSFLVGGWFAAQLSAEFGSPLWPNEWPLAFQLMLALVIIELPQYWLHRLEHETDWLWRFHATHHSAPRLYWLNAARFHVVDIGLLAILYTVPLVALGAGEAVFGLWIVASTIHGICQHANMQIRCGPLNWIFSMAELHRWHHSPLVRESNTNYGQTLILWDIVFGTRFLPKDRKPPEAVGLADLATFPMTWWAQLCSPWRWAKIKSDSAAIASNTAS